MGKLSISGAARATGKARTTIQAHIKKGLVSVECDPTGKKLIDASELQRVYGKLDYTTAGDAVNQSEVLHQVASPNQAGSGQGNDAALKREIELLRQQLEEAREREKKLLGLVEKQTNLLEHRAIKKPFWKVF